MRHLVAVALVLSAATASRADPLRVRSGRVILPITGLAIDLPKDPRKTATWSLSGSWSLSDGGASFDGRDVIDQKLGDDIVNGYWVHIGYFNAGACDAVVNELAVPDRWTAQKELWGAQFAIAGGTWDFENELGKHPVMAMCTSTSNGASLLLYRFLMDPKAPAGAAGLSALAKDTLLPRVVKAWKHGDTGAVFPTRHDEIRQRGDLSAVRTVKLATSKLEVALPDDGFIWLARSGKPDDASDFLDRMAPSVPDVSVEIARADDTDCDEAMPADLGSADDSLNVPSGWRGLRTIPVDNGVERVVCHQQGDTAILVGLLATPSSTTAARDFGPFAPLLAAIAAAVQ
ncbi:MAG TPA: hypothetical protein VL463_05600 [Kofleriaceae bacterium]|nr:hypothetical protein [Kofleriaceae bacterium]